MRQMEAVCLLVQRDGNVGGELREFIIAYFTDNKRGQGPQKRVTLSEKYLNELLGSSLDQFGDKGASDWKPAADRLHHISFVHANYVHGRYPETMDLYGGIPGRFHMDGMRHTPKDGENFLMIDEIITSASLCFVHLVQGLSLTRLLVHDATLVNWYRSYVDGSNAESKS